MYIYTINGITQQTNEDMFDSTNYESIFDPITRKFQYDYYLYTESNADIACIHTTLGVIDFNLSNKMHIYRDDAEMLVGVQELMVGDKLKMYDLPYTSYSVTTNENLSKFLGIGYYNKMASGSPYITSRLNPYIAYAYQSNFETVQHFPSEYMKDMDKALISSINFRRGFLEGLNVARQSDVSLHPLSYHKYSISEMETISMLALSLGEYLKMDLENHNLSVTDNKDCIVTSIELKTGPAYRIEGLETFLANGCYVS